MERNPTELALIEEPCFPMRFHNREASVYQLSILIVVNEMERHKDSLYLSWREFENKLERIIQEIAFLQIKIWFPFFVINTCTLIQAPGLLAISS